MKLRSLLLFRIFATILCGVIALQFLISCSDSIPDKIVPSDTSADQSGSVDVPTDMFDDPPGKDSLTGITAPYCTNQRLFETGGRVNYRIPGMFITNDGTLVAVIGQRYDTTADDAPEQYVVIRRSIDGGLTWSEDSYLNYLENYSVDYRGGVYDALNDTIIIFLRTEIKLPEANEHYNEVNNEDKTFVGNYIMKSTDSGKTWHFNTYELKANSSGIKANIYGNDHGIQIPFGPYAGRLVIGARKGDYNYLVYSDDGGSTWITGARAQEKTGECGLTVLPNGAIYINSRTYTNSGKRYEGWSYDGGETIVDMNVASDLIEPAFGCNASVISFEHPETGKTVMLYSGINNFVPGITSSMTNRYKISVWISYDEGKTWPKCKLIDSDRSAYSSMAYDPTTGLIYILYESGHDVIYDRGANIVTCNLAWLESDEPIPAYTFSHPSDSWQARASNQFEGGTGSEEDPYLIATAEQLALVARLTNRGQSFEGVYFKQISDIDLGGCNWTPIGRASSHNDDKIDLSLPNAPFSGNYDGNGFIIENFSVNGPQYSGSGLFGYVKDATISNILVKGGYIHSAIRSAGIVGWIAGDVDTTKLKNCFYEGTIAYDVPKAEVKESGLFDVSYRAGESVKGDISIFQSYVADGDASSLLPVKCKISWRFLAADSFAKGDGSEQNPYIIETAEELARLAEVVNNGNTLKGKYFKLTSNIDLSAHDWEPIGNAYFNGENHISAESNNLSFEGVLDGGGYTVSGVNIVSRSVGSGFFSYLCGGEVRNLAIKGRVQGTSIVGGFVGFLRPNPNSPTIIENCFFEGEVIASGTNVGGFIGRLHQASGGASSTPANSPRNGILKDLYCKATIDANSENVTTTLFFGGQYNDVGAWTVIKCNVVNDLPENAGIRLNREKRNKPTAISSEEFGQAYNNFKK